MHVLLIVVSTILAYFVLYSPQPLLPLFSRNLSVTETDAALLMTATLLPLSIAPLSYGYLLESVSSLKLLRFSMLLLSLSTMGFALADSFPLLVGLRLGHGLLLPAVFTSILSYVSASAEGAQLQRIMSFFIASGILGGYLGRVLAGLSATYLSWQFFFFALAIALLICFFALGNLDEHVRIRTARTRLNIVIQVLQTGARVRICLAALCLFFVFVALLNFIPFRLTEIHHNPSESLAGLMYSGYLLGLVGTLVAGRIVRLLKGRANTMIACFVVYIVMLLVALIPNVWTLFGALFLFCPSMFLAHSVAITAANQGITRNVGVVNGLYLAFYYSGGVLGSYLPGFVYQRFGWSSFVSILLLVAVVGLLVTVSYRLLGQKD